MHSVEHICSRTRFRTAYTQTELEPERMSERMDKLEGHSRRNNLRIVGVKGRYDENWDQTELRVREVLDEKLQMTNHNEIEIERAHRLKGRDKETCPIIVKFSRYKDRCAVLQRARECLDKGSSVLVHEDFSDRVRKCRRELGKRLVEARNNGAYAIISYDKLIIENEVYVFDDSANQIVRVGYSRKRRSTSVYTYRHEEMQTNQMRRFFKTVIRLVNLYRL